MKAHIGVLTINAVLPLCISINNHLNIIYIYIYTYTDVKTQLMISDIK